MIDIAILNKLNAPTKAERLANLKQVLKETTFPPMVPQYINNHIHTTYSFSRQLSHGGCLCCPDRGTVHRRYYRPRFYFWCRGVPGSG